MALQSCFVAKKYTRPEVVNSDYFRTDSLSQDSATIATVSWRTMFTDSLLVGYIERGMKNNIDIRMALQQMAAPNATVIRNGKEAQVPARELVPGDVILLKAGDKVPADCRLTYEFAQRGLVTR